MWQLCTQNQLVGVERALLKTLVLREQSLVLQLDELLGLRRCLCLKESLCQGCSGLEK